MDEFSENFKRGEGGSFPFQKNYVADFSVLNEHFSSLNFWREGGGMGAVGGGRSLLSVVQSHPLKGRCQKDVCGIRPSVICKLSWYSN